MTSSHVYLLSMNRLKAQAIIHVQLMCAVCGENVSDFEVQTGVGIQKGIQITTRIE